MALLSARTVPGQIRPGYIRVKILELLLVMTELDMKEDLTEHARFTESQIEIIKQVHTFVTEHFSEHHTIEELAERLLKESKLTVGEIAAQIYHALFTIYGNLSGNLSGE